jgi:hypothetical protein
MIYLFQHEWRWNPHETVFCFNEIPGGNVSR